MKPLVCPRCWTPIGKHPKSDFIEVRVRCRGCLAMLTVKTGCSYVLGNTKVPRADTLDAELVDDITSNDPTERLQNKIDCEIMLDSLEPEDRKICQLLDEGYTMEEIGVELGQSRQVIHYKVKGIRKQIANG